MHSPETILLALETRKALFVKMKANSTGLKAKALHDRLLVVKWACAVASSCVALDKSNCKDILLKSLSNQEKIHKDRLQYVKNKTSLATLINTLGEIKRVKKMVEV